MDQTQDQLEFAKRFATVMHTGQTYAGKPYRYHLERVEKILSRFGFGPSAKKGYFYAVCAWLHDIIEDVPGVNYDMIRNGFGKEVADVVFDVTNGLGRNRKERFRYTYPKIRENPDALIIKLADRIANVEQGLENNTSYILMYKKEWPTFKAELYREVSPDGGDQMDRRIRRMWLHLENLFEDV